MESNGAALQVLETDEGVLVWGSHEAMVVARQHPGLDLLEVRPSAALGKAAAALAGTTQFMEESGRWLKLDDVSFAYVKEHGVGNLTRGVVRNRDLVGGHGTQIAKHLRFEPAVLATPALAGGLATMASQQALQESLKEIQDYLEAMDAKLDRLLRQRKLEVGSALGGVIFAVEEAESVRDATGSVSATAWSKIQQNSVELLKLQAEAVGQLKAIADDINTCGKDVDKTGKTLQHAKQDVPFWLSILASTEEIQDRQYLLEFDRVAEESPQSLDAHRRGVRVARAQRAARIGAALNAIHSAVREGSTMTNYGFVVNPFSSREVTRGANSINADIKEYAARTGVDVAGLGTVSNRKWLQAAHGLADDVRNQITDTAAGVARGVGSVGAAIQTKIDDAVVSRAEQITSGRAEIQSKHEARSALDAGRTDSAEKTHESERVQPSESN